MAAPPGTSSPLSAAPAKPRGHLLIRLIACVIGLSTFLVVFGALILLWPNATMHPKPTWTAASGAPPDDRFFRILMFPVNGSAPLFDKPDGVQTPQLLQRAVANTAAEVEFGGWISIADPAGERWARFADLTFIPPPSQEKPLLDALAQSLRARTGDRWVTVALTTEPIPSGLRLTAKIHGDDHHQHSTYTVINGRAAPEQLVLIKGAAVGLSGFPIMIISALVALICAVFAGRLASRRIRAALRRPSTSSTA